MAHFVLYLAYSFHGYYSLVYFFNHQNYCKDHSVSWLRLREGKSISNHTYISNNNNNNMHLIVSGFIF